MARIAEALGDNDRQTTAAGDETDGRGGRRGVREDGQRTWHGESKTRTGSLARSPTTERWRGRPGKSNHKVSEGGPTRLQFGPWGVDFGAGPEVAAPHRPMNRAMAQDQRDQFVGAARASNGEATRPWLGVRFTCAGAYIRVFRNAEGTGYAARCPKCGQCMRFRVGEGGTNQRIFEVSC